MFASSQVLLALAVSAITYAQEMDLAVAESGGGGVAVGGAAAAGAKGWYCSIM